MIFDNFLSKVIFICLLLLCLIMIAISTIPEWLLLLGTSRHTIHKGVFYTKMECLGTNNTSVGVGRQKDKYDLTGYFQVFMELSSRVDPVEEKDLIVMCKSDRECCRRWDLPEIMYGIKASMVLNHYKWRLRSSAAASSFMTPATTVQPVSPRKHI